MIIMKDRNVMEMGEIGFRFRFWGFENGLGAVPLLFTKFTGEMPRNMTHSA